MRALIRRSLRHVNLLATVFLVLAGTSFALAQEPGDSSDPPAAENTAGSNDGGEDDSGNDGSGNGGSGTGGSDNGDDDSGDGDSDQTAGDGDDGDGADLDQGEAELGPLSVTVREGEEVKTGFNRFEVEATARCQDGEALTGGGVRTTDPTRGAKPIVQASHPSPDDPSQWQATVLNSTGNGTLTVVAYAVCAAQSP